MENFKPQYPVSLAEQIEEYLTRAVIQGHLKAGQLLVESELQRKLGVSRTPIREAFRKLEQTGLLTSIPRKGTYVRSIYEKDIRENFPVRAWLEGLAARLAVPNMTEKDIEDLTLNLEGMESAVKKSDFDLYFNKHFAFHNVFIHACMNEQLIRLVKSLRHNPLWYRFTYLWHMENHRHAVPDHRRIVTLFLEKDEDSVEILVRQHILKNMNRYVQYLAQEAASTGSIEATSKSRKNKNTNTDFNSERGLQNETKRHTKNDNEGTLRILQKSDI